MLAYIFSKLEKNPDQTMLGFYYQNLLNALYDAKRKIDKRDKKYVSLIIITLLSHIYKSDHELRTSSLLILEKVMVGFPIYPDVNYKNLDDFNKDFIDQLSTKLNFEEMTFIIKESVAKITEENCNEVLTGFISFHDYYYIKYDENLKNDL